MARRDGFLVYAQVPDETRVQRLRAKAAESGLLAKTLYAGVGSADHLPLAGRAASLVLVTDLSNSDLTEAHRSAWLQAIAPRRGVAILGNPNAKELNEEKLRSLVGRSAGSSSLSPRRWTMGVLSPQARSRCRPVAAEVSRCVECTGIP